LRFGDIADRAEGEMTGRQRCVAVLSVNIRVQIFLKMKYFNGILNESYVNQ